MGRYRIGQSFVSSVPIVGPLGKKLCKLPTGAILVYQGKEGSEEVFSFGLIKVRLGTEAWKHLKKA